MDEVKKNKEKKTVQKNEDDATATGTTESLRMERQAAAALN